MAGAAAPRVKPPASAALLLRSSLRFSDFEPMSLSFADEANEEIARKREYTPIPASVSNEPEMVKECMEREGFDVINR